MSDPECERNDQAGEERHGRGVGLLCLVGSIIGFSSVPLFIKHFTGFLDPWTVNAVRYGTAAVVLLPFVLVLQRRAPGHRSVWRAAALPALANVIGQVLWALTPYYNNASVIAFVIRSSFLFTLMFSFVWLPGERALGRVPLFWLGGATCMGGVALMYAAAVRENGGSTPGGIALVLVTAVFWGLYAVLVRRNLREYPVRLSFGVVCLYTASGLVVLGLFLGDARALVEVEVVNRVLLVVSGLIGIALSHLLMFRAIHALGPVTTAGANLTSPFLTGIGAVLILGETMTLSQWTGGAALIAGTLLLVLAEGRRLGRQPG